MDLFSDCGCRWVFETRNGHLSLGFEEVLLVLNFNRLIPFENNFF